MRSGFGHSDHGVMWEHRGVTPASVGVPSAAPDSAQRRSPAGGPGCRGSRPTGSCETPCMAEAGGCGAGRGSAALVERLAQEFRDRLGVQLVARREPTLPGFPSSIDLVPPVEVERRFGQFRVFVFASAKEAKLLVHDQRPDAQGIYATEVVNERSSEGPDQPPYWSLAKLYGPVLLRWWKADRHAGDSWLRLDAAVRAAVGDG